LHTLPVSFILPRVTCSGKPVPLPFRRIPIAAVYVFQPEESAAWNDESKAG
jgi:hypothetical protein